MATQNLHTHSPQCYHLEVILACMNILNNPDKSGNRNSSNSISPNTNISNDEGYDASPYQLSDISNNLSTPAFSESDNYSVVSNCDEGKCNHVNHFFLSTRRYFKINQGIECYNVPKFEDNFYENIKILLDMFMEKYKSEGSNWLDESIKELNSSDLYTAKKELITLLNSIFEELISWGRIVSMLSYVSQLSLAAIKIGLHKHVHQYISVTVEFIDSKLWEWIKSNGGWSGIENFVNDRNNGHNNTNMNDLFTGFTRLARISAVALAGVAICRFVIDRI